MNRTAATTLGDAILNAPVNDVFVDAPPAGRECAPGREAPGRKKRILFNLYLSGDTAAMRLSQIISLL